MYLKLEIFKTKLFRDFDFKKSFCYSCNFKYNLKYLDVFVTVHHELTVY